MESKEFEPLDQTLNKCREIDLDVRLRKKAEVQHLRLMHELRIRDFLKERDHHADYKEIRKDIEKVTKMLSEAQQLEIQLNESLVKQVNNYTARLSQERNMRKQRELMLDSISSSDNGKVKQLQ